jgi:chorismate mutase/prephenate dehydrogenase
VTDELEALRDEVAALDARIVDLVRERLTTVERIGRLKAARGIPIRDFQVEAQVVRRVEQRCLELGVGGSLGRDLAHLLIDSYLRVQSCIADRGTPSGPGRAVVVGGRGRMGSWLCSFLRAQGHRVTVVDPSGPLEGFAYSSDLEAAVAQADIVVLATPLGRTPKILARVLEAGPPGIVADICSLKSPVIPEIQRGVARGLRVTSFHPMFSAGLGGLAGKNVIICRCGCPEADLVIRDLFGGTGANLAEIAVEEHDELIAYVLGLGHAVNIAFSAALRGSGRGPPELLGLAGYTFARQAALAQDVVSENPDLYFEIQALNPHARGVAKAYLGALAAVEQAAAGGRRGDFLELMESSRRYFEGGGHG